MTTAPPSLPLFLPPGRGRDGRRIAGIDEAGRGPLAGPVVAAAVVLPPGFSDPRLRDSKRMTPAARAVLAPVIRDAAVAWSVVAVGARRIERLDILRASLLAMRLAARRVAAEVVAVDGNVPIDVDAEQHVVVRGDSLYADIAAASVLAKVRRDELMGVLDRRYPGYGFARHAGYPTALHAEALGRLGPSRVHRRTFAGCHPLPPPIRRRPERPP